MSTSRLDAIVSPYCLPNRLYGCGIFYDSIMWNDRANICYLTLREFQVHVFLIDSTSARSWDVLPIRSKSSLGGSGQKGGEISIQGEGILEILPPSFECCNGSVLREGPLFWSSVWIHTLTIRNSEGILSFRWDGALLRVHPNHRIGWLVVAWISKTTLGLTGFLALRDVD